MTPQPQEEGRKRSPEDYVFGKVIGEGSFSTVYLAKDIHTNKEFASEFFLFFGCLAGCFGFYFG